MMASWNSTIQVKIYISVFLSLARSLSVSLLFFILSLYQLVALLWETGVFWETLTIAVFLCFLERSISQTINKLLEAALIKDNVVEFPSLGGLANLLYYLNILLYEKKCFYMSFFFLFSLVFSHLCERTRSSMEVASFFFHISFLFFSCFSSSILYSLFFFIP